jgi:hypothetical protein
MTSVSSDISQASMRAANEARNSSSSNRPVLRKSASMGFQQGQDEIRYEMSCSCDFELSVDVKFLAFRWMQIRRITLRTADGLNPTPMAMSWVRDGVLMCGMDNEITVYSQWRDDSIKAIGSDGNGDLEAVEKDIHDHRSLKESDILSLAQVRLQLRHEIIFIFQFYIFLLGVQNEKRQEQRLILKFDQRQEHK